jgi:hypothetical protein
MIRHAIAFSVILIFTGNGHTETVYHCNGILTSNNVCIGSESNVDSVDSHEPIYGDSYYTKPDPRSQEERP